MNPRTEKAFAIFLAILLLLATISTYNVFTFKHRQINRACQLMKEYKTAKAIEILDKLKSKYKNKDKDLDSLYFYALIKAKKFDQAERQIKNIDEISERFKDNFVEIIDLLSTYYKTNLMTEFIRKSKNMNFTEDFFIKLSANSRSFEAESKILVQGLSYLRASNKNKAEKLEKYIFDRYIEIAKIAMSHEDFVLATSYMTKLKELKVILNEKDQQDFFLTLGDIYKKSKNPDLARENYQMAAQAGSKKAEKLVNTL